ncbi:DinB family protein [Paenibacillus sp. N3/727]|uniref:DinB family protein n=1 Tax=Paenibacillus sp. N3/727 TaxID=2925845 RepID=UPI001F52CB34|nr:DinB family protein [Paenibacillus sp. N3/727]UNK17165.1 DinB family protein [Paenibacillus sp. N3/727]
MTFTTVSQIWNAVQDRFHQTAKNLPEQDLPLKLGNASIGYMLRHNAEVEYMFADWFFNRPLPEGLAIHTARGAAGAENEFTNLQELLAILKASNEHMLDAMRELPEEKWNEPVKSPMGLSTPLEAVGRLMYHTGIHAGQISLIQKCATVQRP